MIENHLFNTGSAEPCVQSVQLHTHFFAPSFAKTQVLSWKILISHNLEASAAPVQ